MSIFWYLQYLQKYPYFDYSFVSLRDYFLLHFFISLLRSTCPPSYHISHEKCWDSNEESKKVWFESEDRFFFEEKLNRNPGSHSDEHREECIDGVDSFSIDTEDKRDKGSSERDLIRALHHRKYLCFIMSVLVRNKWHDYEKGSKHRKTSEEKELRTGDMRKKWLHDVLSEESRRRKEGSTRRRHDGREEGTEEHHLHEDRSFLENESWEDALGIISSHEFRGYHVGSVSKHDRDKGKDDIETSADDRTSTSIFFTIGREDSLEYILLRDRTKSHREHGREDSDDTHECNWLRSEEWKLAIGNCRWNHIRHTTSITSDIPGNEEHTHHDDDHLEKVRHRHRPHTSENGIDENNSTADKWPLCLSEAREGSSFGDDIKDESERDNLCWYPSNIRDNNHDRGEDFYGATVFLSIKITERLDAHPIEWPSKKETYEDETESRTKRIRENPDNPFLEKGRRSAKHGLRAKPRSKGRRNHDIEREPASSEDIVVVRLDSPRRIEPYRDGYDEIDDYPENERGEHGNSS